MPDTLLCYQDRANPFFREFEQLWDCWGRHMAVVDTGDARCAWEALRRDEMLQSVGIRAGCVKRSLRVAARDVAREAIRGADREKPRISATPCPGAEPKRQLAPAHQRIQSHDYGVRKVGIPVL
jgi:hypothetical protein